MNVLIIDDDVALLRSLEILLSTQGHEVRTFSDPGEASASLQHHWVPDVVILDYLIPPLTGDEVLRRLRPGFTGDCRVILISGHTDLLDPFVLESMGVHAFLPKPLDIDRLSELVDAGTKEVNGAV